VTAAGGKSTVPRMATTISLEGVHCTISIYLASPAAVVIRIEGQDSGELGDRPFEVLDQLLATGDRPQLFVDAREARGPSVDVSARWAKWLRDNKERYRIVNMLTRSKFVQLTADFVQRFSQLEDRMRIYTEAAAFDTALALAAP
jgi:hypothetical protein